MSSAVTTTPIEDLSIWLHDNLCHDSHYDQCFFRKEEPSFGKNYAHDYYRTMATSLLSLYDFTTAQQMMLPGIADSKAKHDQHMKSIGLAR